MFVFVATGFGRSSRPSFSSDALTAEKQLVRSIEEWRREMKIQNMILLGHSMGGFLATSYTISYPGRYFLNPTNTIKNRLISFHLSVLTNNNLTE